MSALATAVETVQAEVNRTHEKVEATKDLVSARVHHRSERVTLWHGQALDVLRGMKDASVDCVVTSPPYFGLRDYAVDGQIGMEPTMSEYVENLRSVFAEMRRVLADDGTFWLNLGDSYSSGSRTYYDTSSGKTAGRVGHARPTSGLPGKNLLGIPWRVALALQEDGWILRNDVIWSKPNAMPFSGKDRLASRYEHVFLFTKSSGYHFDLDAIRIPHTSPQTSNPLGKNPGDVWTISTKPFPEAHFATYPPELPLVCVRAGCKPNGVVLDPFSGAGTTGLAALEEGHRYVGIDLSAEYLDLSLRTRLEGS